MEKTTIQKTTAISLVLALAIPTTAMAFTATVTQDEAEAIALAHAGIVETDVTYMTSKLDYDDGAWEYDVEFWVGTTEYDYEIHATTGVICSYDFEVKYSSEYTASTTSTTDYIGEIEATVIALAHAGLTEADTSKLKVEFDVERGVAEYEVEWEIGRKEYEYTINARTGEILEVDVDYD